MARLATGCWLLRAAFVAASVCMGRAARARRRSLASRPHASTLGERCCRRRLRRSAAWSAISCPRGRFICGARRCRSARAAPGSTPARVRRRDRRVARAHGRHAGSAPAAPSAGSPSTAPRLAPRAGRAPTAATLVYEWTTGDMPSHAIRAAAGVPIGLVGRVAGRGGRGESGKLTTVRATAAEETQSGTLFLLCLASWAIPGAGHLWLGRRSKGLILLVALPLMFAIGLAHPRPPVSVRAVRSAGRPRGVCRPGHRRDLFHRQRARLRRRRRARGHLRVRQRVSDRRRPAQPAGRHRRLRHRAWGRKYSAEPLRCCW